MAYILFAEYFTVLLGPEWLAAIESGSGVPRSAVSVVAPHVEQRALAGERAHHDPLLEARELEVEASEGGLHGLWAGEMRLERRHFAAARINSR